MDNIYLPEIYICEYILDTLSDAKNIRNDVSNARYHHNALYKDAPLICKYGILTFNDLNRLGIRNDSNEFLKIMNDTDSHVNGNDSVSLSVVGLDDLYRDEYEYNPFSPNLVDFIITSELFASRSSIHYGNEFLSAGSISVDKFRAIDLRFIEYIRQCSNSIDHLFIENIIQKYNFIRKIAYELKMQVLNVPLREMSESNIFELDVDRMLKQPNLVLKK